MILLLDAALRVLVNAERVLSLKMLPSLQT